MDQRLVVTVALAFHLLAGVLMILATVSVETSFTEGQPTFVGFVGYVVPLVAVVMIWVRNYVFGPPLLAGAGATNAGFVAYFWFVFPNPAHVSAVSGDATTAYAAAAVLVTVTSSLCALGGLWLWYRESRWFRSQVDGVFRA